MKSFEIRVRGSIIDGELVLEEPRVVDLNAYDEALTSEFIIRESQSRYGYLHFPKDTGFQNYIKDGRDIKINYNNKSYMAKSYKPMDGRVNGLSSFFRENEELKEDVKLQMELNVKKEILELNIKKK